jgi:CRISPR-associated endoribonuclease Cas6
MRVKITGEILQKTNRDKRNYTHGIYAMIMQHLKPETAQRFHQKNKEIRLFTFSNLYIPKKLNHDGKDPVHFYIGGTDEFMEELIEGLVKAYLIKIEDVNIVIKKIEPEEELKPQPSYLFKSKVVVNIPKDGKNQLLDDIPAVEERLRRNAIKKANLLGRDGDISFRLINPVKHVERYKNGHIFSWKSLIEVKGDYEVVKTIYEVGCGENTATGHGMLFQVKGAMNHIEAV